MPTLESPALITVIILTKDEERHIARAIRSVRLLPSQILVVDSGSTDRTVEIARSLGAKVISNLWHNHATQFNWAIDQLPQDGRWILRLDADEVVSPELVQQIVDTLPAYDDAVGGVYVSRRMTFMGRSIRHGGVFPIRVLRLFRLGAGRCENRWMDEHIQVSGKTADLYGEILDDNLNGLDWWIAKHNGYSNREVLDLLNLEYGFMPHETVANLRSGRQAEVKRWLKERIYSRLPGGLRASAYFVYRYFFRLGFLDGREGMNFHVLQAFWYRFLVDAKLYEVRKYMRQNDVDVITAVNLVLGIDLRKA